MRITGLSLSNFEFCTATVSGESYGGNVIMHADGHNRTANRDGTKQCTARLAVLDSRGPGSRTSANGRHGPYACWHAYRDVLMRVFTRYPDAVIRTGIAVYRGMAGFRELYPATAHRVIGPEINPVTMPELCECDELGDSIRAIAAESPDRGVRTANHQTGEYVPLQYRGLAGIMMREMLATYTIGSPQQAFPREREPDRDIGNADYVSPAVEEASRQYARSAELLGEKEHIDEYVFGPGYHRDADYY